MLRILTDVRTRRGGGVLVTAAWAFAMSAVGAAPATAAPQPINGVLSITPGSCGGGSAGGSFFRMILPDGNSNGPFLSNGDSTCSDKTITPLSPGTDGGLRSGAYQPQPSSAFDAQGNALSGSVTRPVKFYGVGFATATNPTDPQTHAATARPQLFLDGSTLSGNLSALGVTWNNQVFNQGAPKPGGSYPGKTTPVKGQYDAGSGTYVIEWTSQIVGGPFNNFTGLWHLTGRLSGAPSQNRGRAVNPGGRPAADGHAGVPGNSAPGPGSSPVGAAPGPSPAPGAPVAGPALAAPAPVNNNVTVQARDDHGATSSRWFTALLVLAAAIAAAVLSNADRLFRRRGDS